MPISRRLRAIIWSLILSTATFSEAGRAEDKSPEFTPESLEFFERNVRPLLAEHCASCHSAKFGNRKGGLSLDTREQILQGGDSGEAIVPGKPEESLLVEAIRRESYEMPPEKALAPKARETLERWVAMGAPWPRETTAATAGDWLAQRAASHWAWQPVAVPRLPEVPQDDWSLQPLDRFILARLQQEGLTPAAAADSATLLRRLSFDLTGLPPSRAMLQRFADLSDPRDRERLVEELLASPQFGVQWGRHWLDLVRYAETLGHEFDYPIHAPWRYRDSVIDALNVDLSYRDFVEEQIAGDQLAQPRRHPLTGVDQSLAATAWWWLGESIHAPVDIQNDWASRIDNQIDVFSKTFLGMTIACARCHDHKFDAISVDDYYGLSGIIESSRRQYAITDPQGAIGTHQQTIAAVIEEADAVAEETYSKVAESQLLQWLEASLKHLRGLDAGKREQLLSNSSALAPLRLLLDAAPDQPLQSRAAKLRTQLTRAREEYAAWLQDSQLFADFSSGLPAGWQLNGSPSPAVASPRFEWFSSGLPMPARHGIFSSQWLGRHSSLAIHSPTFDVSSTHVCFKVRGKSTQSAVVVGNYFMQEFHSLLFKDLRKPLDQPHDSGWVTHAGDLNKYLGQPAYLSLEDEGQAWFEVEQVRFADRAPPGEPSDFAIQVLADELDTPAELLQRLASALSKRLDDPSGLAATDVAPFRALLQASLDLESPLPLEGMQQLRDISQQLTQLDASTPAPTIVLSTQEGTPRNSAVALRGNPHMRGEAVPRNCLVRLVSTESAAANSSGRLELSKSLVRGDHPLTARVMVNRVWHHLMGRGLAATPDNLGELGSRPTHPQLLDYLTREFVEHDWSIKWLVREIALSQTYRLSSQTNAAQRELDGDGRLWSYRPVRRLTAEALRDAMMATVNSLDQQLGGPSVPVHLSEQMTGRGRPKDSGPLDGNNRRTVFIEVRRNFLDPLLMAFDFPMPATSVGNRNSSNVPAQALGLLNDPLVLEMTRRWAADSARISDPRERIEYMLETAFSRPATTAEVEHCLSFVADDELAWNELAHVLLNAKEFSYLK